MKRIVSLLTIVAILFTSVAVFADGKQVTPNVEVSKNTNIDGEFTFEIQWKLDKANKGDYFFVDFPFPVEVNGGDIVDVEAVGSRYRLIFKDDYINTWGEIGGKRRVDVTKLPPVKVNGEAIPVNYERPQGGGGTGNPEVGDRDRIYKHGFIQEDNTIYWEVTIGGDGKGVNAGTQVTDEIGKGHKLIKDSLKFEVIDEFGNYNDQLAEMVIRDKKTSSNEIEFTIDGIAPGEVLIVSYKTQITDPEQGKFENMVIVEGEKKISQEVKIESWGNSGGEKPEPEPTDPDPKPTDPDPTDPDPELPGKLPQVGEKFFKPQHFIGALLVAAGLFIRNKED